EKNDVDTLSGAATSGLLRTSGVASRLPAASNRIGTAPPRAVYDSGTVGVDQSTAPAATADRAAAWPKMVGVFPSPWACGSANPPPVIATHFSTVGGVPWASWKAMANWVAVVLVLVKSTTSTASLVARLLVLNCCTRVAPVGSVMSTSRSPVTWNPGRALPPSRKALSHWNTSTISAP